MLSRLSLGLTFCLASLVACTSATGPGASGDDTPGAAVAAEPAAPLSSTEIAAIMQQPKISADQLTALLGGRVPATAGQICSNLFQPCDANIDAPLTACGGFVGPCGAHGTQQVQPLRFLCIPDTTGVGKCTALQNGDAHAASCIVPTDGKSCSTGFTDVPVCNYSSTCDVSADQTQHFLSGGTCSNEQCINQTQTNPVTGTCTRDTAGNRCSESEIPPDQLPCQRPTVPLCSVSHVCGCLLGAQ
ncbi:MAG TPA: hypothetical protein VFP84_24035 [Kofleriaceae bacterium]|nr:hypothetical protein [Kofleriaceae bacterium]